MKFSFGFFPLLVASANAAANAAANGDVPDIDPECPDGLSTNVQYQWFDMPAESPPQEADITAAAVDTLMEQQDAFFTDVAQGYQTAVYGSNNIESVNLTYNFEDCQMFFSVPSMRNIWCPANISITYIDETSDQVWNCSDWFAHAVTASSWPNGYDPSTVRNGNQAQPLLDFVYQYIWPEGGIFYDIQTTRFCSQIPDNPVGACKGPYRNAEDSEGVEGAPEVGVTATRDAQEASSNATATDANATETATTATDGEAEAEAEETEPTSAASKLALTTVSVAWMVCAWLF